MAIIDTITNDFAFAEWLKKSDNYKNNFTWEGANALQAYYEQLSDELDQDLEFDPVAWCCEWSEYKSLKDALKYYDNNEAIAEEGLTLDDFTEVITLDNGGVIVRDF